MHSSSSPSSTVCLDVATSPLLRLSTRPELSPQNNALEGAPYNGSSVMEDTPTQLDSSIFSQLLASRSSGCLRPCTLIELLPQLPRNMPAASQATSFIEPAWASILTPGLKAPASPSKIQSVPREVPSATFLSCGASAVISSSGGVARRQYWSIVTLRRAAAHCVLAVAASGSLWSAVRCVSSCAGHRFDRCYALHVCSRPLSLIGRFGEMPS